METHRSYDRQGEASANLGVPRAVAQARWGLGARGQGTRRELSYFFSRPTLPEAESNASTHPSHSPLQHVWGSL
jgi:hypothetical protein